MASDNEDFSDLTDLSEEDEYRASSSKSKKKRRNLSPSTYRIRNALKVPRATTYTAQALYDQMHSDDIKLDPDYQRDVVWPDTKMVGLVDSIFRNFYVPPVIFSVVAYDDGSEKRICIDGKQRLTSIQRFMDGLIPHKDPITSQRLWYTDTGAGGGKAKKKLLPLKYRKLFATKQIVCVEYTDVTDNDEREIFQRVQLGMALTPAEKLQVVSTPRSAFIRSLLSHFLSSSTSPSEDGAGSLSHFDWERNRGADYRSISQIVYCLYSFPAFAPPGHTTDLLRASSLKNLGPVATLEKFLSDPVPFTDEFEENVRATMRVVGAMATDRGMIANGKEKMEVREVFKSPTKVAPVELVLVGLLVGSHMTAAGCTGAISGAGAKKESKVERGEREVREAEGRKRLAEGIRDMRAEVRKTHVDIRMNARVARTMVDFVKQWRPNVVMSSSSSSTIVASSSSSSSGIRKRKRETSNAQGSMEDGEVNSDDGIRFGNGNGNEHDDGDDVPLRQKYKKIGIGHSPSISQPPPPVPPVPPVPPPSLPTYAPPKPKPLSIPMSSVTAPHKPDRMAALRAVKMQMQMQGDGGGGGGGGGGSIPPPQRAWSSAALTNSHGNGSPKVYGWGQGQVISQGSASTSASASSSGTWQAQPPQERR